MCREMCRKMCREMRSEMCRDSLDAMCSEMCSDSLDAQKPPWSQDRQEIVLHSQQIVFHSQDMPLVDRKIGYLAMLAMLFVFHSQHTPLLLLFCLAVSGIHSSNTWVQQQHVGALPRQACVFVHHLCTICAPFVHHLCTTHINTRTLIHAHTYIYAHTHTHTHKHTHTCAHTQKAHARSHTNMHMRTSEIPRERGGKIAHQCTGNAPTSRAHQCKDNQMRAGRAPLHTHKEFSLTPKEFSLTPSISHMYTCMFACERASFIHTIQLFVW